MGISTDSTFKYNAKGDWITSCNRNHLLQHIRKGGEVFDSVGKQIAGQFVDGMMMSKDFAELALSHRFNKDDLIWIIIFITAAGIDGEIPNPCVQDAMPRLLGCVLLQNHVLLEQVMINANRLLNDDEFIESVVNGRFKSQYVNATLQQRTANLRREAISKASVSVGKACYDHITAVNGPPPEFVVDSGGSGVETAKPPGGCGCAALIILLATLGITSSVWALAR